MAQDDDADRQMITMRDRVRASLDLMTISLRALNESAKGATNNGGGIFKLDAMIGTIGKGLLGTAGVVYGVRQLGLALDNVATQSLGMERFARDLRLTGQSVDNLRQGFRLMGVDSGEADRAMAGLMGTLKDISVRGEGSDAYDALAKSTGGAVLHARLKALMRAGKVDEARNEVFAGYARQDNADSRSRYAQIFNMSESMFEDLPKALAKNIPNLNRINAEAAKEFHESWATTGIRLQSVWNGMVNEAMDSSNKIGRAFNDAGLTSEKGANALSFIIENGILSHIRQTTNEITLGIKGIGQAVDAFKAITDPNTSEDKKFRKWPWQSQGDDFNDRFPGADAFKSGAKPLTDFGGMRRTDSVEREQTGVLVEIRDTLQGRTPGLGGGSGGTSSSMGAQYGSGGARANLARYLGMERSGGGNITASGGTTGANTAKVMEYMTDQLRKEGVPEANVRHAAALLTGQAQAESNLDPNTVHDGGTGYGIYGARNDRRSRMLSWLKANGYAANSLEGQSRYMAYEAMNDKTYAPSRRALMGASPETMASGTSTLTNNFERPARDNSSVRLGHAQKALTGGITPQPGSDSEGSPSAFIMHHTGGRGTVEGVRETLRQRGLGVQYIMDRDGNIVEGGGDMRSHMKRGWGPLGSGLSNSNTVGMEVIAKNDADVTPAQRAAALKFMRERYGNVPVYGHGQVNPGHKEDSEGMSIVNDINRDRATIDGKAKRDEVWAKGAAAIKVDFNGVPNGVTTKAEVSGDLFKDLNISRTRQAGSPDDFASRWPN